ncbi:MAG: cobyrinate a,c-diamide synthase [Oscillospiraceae bacterium]|nr:cobyrinate a,c-diamide synthase [Oscillospiraceae bacterium]
MNRLLIAGTGSGCGKTTITMALLAALKARGLGVSSFKCGPDYIDPMFHREAIGIPSYNLDPFFSEDDQLRSLFAVHGGKDISVMEGVMGFYDGIGIEGRCSTYDVARATETPVVLVINAKGMSTSLGAMLAGFKGFKENSRIQGVIFNGVASGMLPMLSAIAEKQGIRAYGCFPRMEELSVGSRNLGLITAGEIEDIRRIIAELGKLAEENLDIDGLLQLAASAADITVPSYGSVAVRKQVRIGVAMDKAFCFRYQDNLDLLEAMGAELVPFSPMTDSALPDDIHALYLCGGYPELHMDALSGNQSMRTSIKTKILSGLPTFAECGGFMYLHDDIDGVPMCGVISGSSVRKNRLQRFGYVTLTTGKDGLFGPAGSRIRAHEFHYFDSSNNGVDCSSEKASNGTVYACCHVTDSLFAGYPHLYFPANPQFAENFIRKAADYAASL